MSELQLQTLLTEHGVPPSEYEHVLEFLLYFGFLGIRVGEDVPLYIYDVGYDLSILRAVYRKKHRAARLVLNPAFWPALEAGITD